ncbi:MAG: alkaline phosphatase [Sphaerochaetaceae bacterium]|nr:alkaline phosphatase [Sphaerochaetaceae bacterium]
MRKIKAIVLAISIFVLLVSCKHEIHPYSSLDFTKEEGPIRNVILVIGDGMGQNHVNAGNAYIKDGLSFYGWNKVLSNTDSVKASGKRDTTDSAAGATALATGVLTINSYVGVDPAMNELHTIMDYAKHIGKSTGIVTTDGLTGATPAGFSGHATSRDDYSQIFDTQLTSNVDLLCASRIPSSAGKNKTARLQDAGYLYVDDLEKFGEAAQGTSKICAIFDMATKDAPIALEDAVSIALDYLDSDPDGFVLMVEQAYIDKYSHENNVDGMLASMVSISETVKAIATWMEDRDDTVLLVTADHETGGLAISESENLGKSVTEQDGDTLYYAWSRTNHSNTPVYLFAHGQILEQFFKDNYPEGTVIKNTETFRIMLKCIGNRL